VEDEESVRPTKSPESRARRKKIKTELLARFDQPEAMEELSKANEVYRQFLSPSVSGARG
jgi:hypothetical protein